MLFLFSILLIGCIRLTDLRIFDPDVYFGGKSHLAAM